MRQEFPQPVAVQPEYTGDWNKCWPTAQYMAPKTCMVCGARTKKPEVLKLGWSNEERHVWPYNLLVTLRESQSWVVLCTKCPAVHRWSFPNVYKVYVDPMTNITLSEN